MSSPRVARRASVGAARPSLFLSLLVLVLLVPAAAHAQLVRPWTPAGMDTLQRMATEARVRFQRVKTDSVDEGSITAYDLVAQVSRRLLGQLGRQGSLQAQAIAGSLDSLGLDVEVVNDPFVPSIVMVLVRNPFRITADNVAFLIWYRGRELHYQGATFPPCTRLKLRSWWSGRPQFPYEVGMTYVVRGKKPFQEFALFRMNPDGNTWQGVQYGKQGPDLGVAGESNFADVNADGQPELLAWTPVDADSFLALAPSVPKLT